MPPGLLSPLISVAKLLPGFGIRSTSPVFVVVYMELASSTMKVGAIGIASSVGPPVQPVSGHESTLSEPLIVKYTLSVSTARKNEFGSPSASWVGATAPLQPVSGHFMIAPVM